MEEGTWSGVNAFSLGVQVLYYNISKRRNCSVSCGKKIDDYGEIRFSGVAGVNSDNFLELLNFYLPSTVVNFEDKLYAQRGGIRIGSSFAPIFSGLFLSAFDKRVSLSLD